MNPDLQSQPGARVYRPWLLLVYDFWVLGVSNRFAWRCSSSRLLEHYNKNIGASHLDVGVGSGWYLAHCKFPADKPEVTLVDLSPASLDATVARIRHLSPLRVEADILQPLSNISRKHDSVAINYLLHCLPGSLSQKLPRVVASLVPLMKANAVLFGSTILGKGVTHNAFGRLLMSAYNEKGFFSNIEDSQADLEQILRNNFTDVHVEVVGCVAIFAAKNR